MGTSEGATQLRYNFYPKVEELKQVKTDQIRCGEHTDYGAITLITSYFTTKWSVINITGQGRTKLYKSLPIEKKNANLS